MYVFFTRLISFSLFVVLCSTSLYAEDGIVKVRIREIHGLGIANKANGDVSISEELRDLDKKLKKLNYQEYQLLDTQMQEVVLKQRANLSFSDGHVLTVRPLYLTPAGEASRISMWIHWADKLGMEILDTRMHFTCGEAMLTGVEQTNKDGRILAIDVTPVK